MTVLITEVMVGPGTVDGMAWDGSRAIDPALIRQIASALLSIDPWSAVIAILGGGLLDYYESPDPYGWAEISVGGVFYPEAAWWLATEVDNAEDTYIMATQGGWEGVPLDEDVRIAVTLYDEDLVNDDYMGRVELNSQDLRAALNARRIYAVPVHAQSSNQLLFVRISVTETP